MLKPRKTAAFMLSLLLCASAFMPAASYADTEYEGWGESDAPTYVDEDGNTYSSEDELIASYPVSGDFSYSVMDDGNACIELYSGTDKDVVIPDTVDGKKVTYLGRKALGSDHDNSPVETVALPASIEYINSLQKHRQPQRDNRR